MDLKKFYKWFSTQRKINKFKVKKKELNKISNWKVNYEKISHVTNKFFQIIGIKVKYEG